MNWFFDNFQSIIFILTTVTVGVFAFWGIFDQKIKSRQKELNDQEDRLIKLYKSQIDELKIKQQENENKINDLSVRYEKKIIELNNQIVKVQSENNLLKEVLQGKDNTTVEFQKQGFEAIERIRKTESDINLGFASVNNNIIRLAKAIEKHLEK